MADDLSNWNKRPSFWLAGARDRVENEASRLEEAARQIITITILLQGIYSALIIFSDLKRTLVLTYPSIMWLISLSLALIIMMFRAQEKELPAQYMFSWDKIPGKDIEILLEFLTKKFGIGWVKSAKIEKIDNDKTIKISTERNSLSLKLDNKIKEVIMEIDGHRTNKFIANVDDDELNIYSAQDSIDHEYIRTSKFIKTTEYKRKILISSYLFLLLGLTLLIFIQMPTVSQDQSLKIPLELPQNISRANNEETEINVSKINANVSTPSFVIQKYYSSDNIVETGQENAINSSGITMHSLGHLSIIAIIIGLVFGVIIATLWFARKHQDETEWWKHPLGLPNGSIRAIIALILVIAIILYGNQPQPWLMGVVGTIIGFYFGSRSINNKN